MLNQSLSKSNLLKLIGYADYTKYKQLGVSKKQTMEIMNDISKTISDPSYKVESVNSIELNDFQIFSLNTIESDFALRKINDSLKRFYKVKQADRNLIVFQIIALLKESIPMSIIKLDIQKFYESIDRNSLLEKLTNDSLLSENSIRILTEFFELPEFGGFKGLPRGINLSATLSELFLRDFDRKVNFHPSVYYYSRYVDDIIIFTTGDPSMVIKEIEDEMFLPLPLAFNSKKTKSFQVKPKSTQPENILFFEYLGYRFSFSDVAVKSKNEFTDKSIKVSLAEKKVKRYKTRIVKAFLDYLKSSDFGLLESRIKFLTGNYPIKTNFSDNSVLYSGLYFNYPFINDQSDLIDLTLFLRKIISAKNKSFGTKMSVALNAAQRQRLSRYNFKAGWDNRKVNSHFGPDLVKEIKKCWRNG
ncbi:antiviral reverse transcriptase Drt3a [Roseivirga thermotolerans]|nr:antiviral reverse transcriptase Drt3a [Roseivirga thermotolerans]